MTRNATILLIEDHPIAAEILRSFISMHKPFCKIVWADSPEQALARLKQEPVHLIITDLQITQQQDSFAFLAVLNGWNPPIPIIAISENRSEEISAMAGGITVLHKPIDFEVLLELISTMTLAAQESVLNGVSLENFLQMIEQERKTCSLRIMSGYQTGHLDVSMGRLVDARTGTLRQKEAVLTILGWPNCTISITESGPIVPTMNISIQSLLVEWCIFKDERERSPSWLETA